MSAGPRAPARPPHPLSIGAYRLFFAARLAAMLAQGSLVIVLGWTVYGVARATMSVEAASLRLGLIGLVQFLPFLLLSPVTGWVADRFDRRHVVRAALGVQIAAAGALTAAALAGGTPLALLYGAAAVFAGARAFSMPAMNALAPLLVPADVLPAAVAIGAIAGRIGGIVGPVIGGMLYALAPAAAFGASAGLLVLALGCQARIATRGSGQVRVRGHPFRLWLEGLSYVRGNRLLLGAISLDLVAVLLGGVTALLPAFARDVLHVGAAGLGWLRAASSAGALATAAAMAWRPLRRGLGWAMLAGVAAYGLATIGFGVSRDLVVSLGCLVVLGAGDMLSVFVRQSLVQIATPDDRRGRVGAVSSLFISASNELGEVESGLLAAMVGPVGAVVIGGVCSVAVALAWGAMFPELRRLDRFVPAEAMPGAT